jgi:hypothetical protein
MSSNSDRGSREKPNPSKAKATADNQRGRNSSNRKAIPSKAKVSSDTQRDDKFGLVTAYSEKGVTGHIEKKMRANGASTSAAVTAGTAAAGLAEQAARETWKLGRGKSQLVASGKLLRSEFSTKLIFETS